MTDGTAIPFAAQFAAVSPDWSRAEIVRSDLRLAGAATESIPQEESPK